MDTVRQVNLVRVDVRMFFREVPLTGAVNIGNMWL